LAFGSGLSCRAARGLSFPPAGPLSVCTAVSASTRRLTRQIAQLIKANERLCKVLEQQRTLMSETFQNIEPRGLGVEVLVSRGAAPMREELTNALDEFDRVRHMVRLSLFVVLGQEQGVSISEIARTLGISRQLASRLAQEAAEEG